MPQVELLKKEKKRQVGGGSHWLHSIYFFNLWYFLLLNLEYAVPACSFWHLFLVSELPVSVVWCMALILDDSESLLPQILLLSLSFFFRCPSAVYVIPFVLISQFLDILDVSPPSVFLSLLFSFGHSYCFVFKHRASFLTMASVLMSPSEASFISVRVFHL